MLTMEQYQNWEGTVEDLAKVANEVLISLGRSDIQPPNVRLIRDYAQRGILSPSERRGKEAYYHIQHLQELVAARILITEGVPLAKIAEQFQRDRDIVIVTLGQPSASAAAASPAQARWESLGSKKASVKFSRNSNFDAEEPASSMFMRQAFEDAGQKVDMQSRLSRLGSDSLDPQVDKIIRLQITKWCWLLIDAKKLRGLSVEEAEDIGHSISTALMDPRIKRGESS